MKIIRNVLVVFLVAMLLTSCAGDMNFIVPFDGTLGGGFQFGIFQGFIVWPVALLINHLSQFLGSAGIAMIIATLVARTITLPVTVKGQLATRGMQELQPKMAAIEEKYKGREDQQSKARKAQEMQNIYKDMGVSPFSGMLYPLLSMPIFMGMWRATNTSAAINEAGATFLGFNLGDTPQAAIANGQFQYIIIMLLVAITQFVQFKISTHLQRQRTASKKSYRVNPQQEKLQKQMGMMTYIFTAVMLFMSFTLHTAMSFYLIVSALISLAQAFYIDKKMRED